MQLNKSVTESSEERPLLNANELMELHKGEFIVKRVMHRTDITGADILPYPIFNRGKSRMPYRYEYLQEEFDTSKRMPDGSYDETGDVDLHSIVLDAQTVMADIYGGNYEETEAYMLSERLTKDKLALIASELGAEISALNKMSNISLKEYMENQQFSDSQRKQCVGNTGRGGNVTQQQIIEILKQFEPYLHQAGILNNILRDFGWVIIKLLVMLLDSVESMLDMFYGLFNFFEYPEVSEFIDSFRPVLWVLFAISLAALGIQLIIQGKENRSHIVTNIIVAVMILTALPNVMTALNDFTLAGIEFVNPEYTLR